MRYSEPEAFLESDSGTLVLDVRSPSEFRQGHMPGAISFPLFSDEERRDVGICYKQEGQEAAVLLGLRMVGPRLAEMVQKARKIAEHRSVKLYCWRGGMRSGSVAWLLNTAGFKTEVLQGGYKNYRKYVLQHIKFPEKGVVLGGYTGTGKTELLHALKEEGEQIIDLEALAGHRGSAFGLPEGAEQPGMEQFENDLLRVIQQLDQEKVVWVEDESKKIGTVFIRPQFYEGLEKAPLVVIDKCQEDRAAYLASTYGSESKGRLKSGFERIAKRLGGQHVKRALECIEDEKFSEAAAIALVYYDKTYAHGLSNRKSRSISYIPATGLSNAQIVNELIQLKHRIHG